MKKVFARRGGESSDFVFAETCLSIPGIWKQEYHSLCSAVALVNNPSLGATSESPAWSLTWWVLCQFRAGQGKRGGEGEFEGWGVKEGGVVSKLALASL